MKYTYNFASKYWKKILIILNGQEKLALLLSTSKVGDC